MSLKTCTACRVELPLSAFASTGSGRMRARCRKCQNAWNREHHATPARPQRHLGQMVCVCCGEAKPDYKFPNKSTGKGKRTKCRECEDDGKRERYLNGKERRRIGYRGRPDRDDWHKLMQPWPWEPGVKVFEDIQFRKLL